MTCGKTNKFDALISRLRYVGKRALVCIVVVVWLLFATTGGAFGQSPTSVVNLVPEVIEAVPSSVIDFDFHDAPLHDAFQYDASLQDASQYDLTEFQGSGSVVNSFIAPPMEDLPCTTCATTQSVRLRKNVLGCKANYTVLPQDEIWIVSARDCSCDPGNVGLIKVKKLENHRWQPSSLQTLSNAHLNDTSRTTMLYVHGNQTDYEYGISRGFQFYNNLFVQHVCPRAPVRLVLWLWQSERELPRLYSDYIVKSNRAMTMGKTLTKTLEALGNRKLALVGFSLGAQVILSSLEQMEPRRGCPIAAGQRDKYNVALIAPATAPDYVCDIINRNVQTSIVRMSTIIVNSDDRAVKAMRFVIRHECPEARNDFCKLVRCNHLPLGKTEFLEISQEISRKHSIERYTKAPTAKRALCGVLNRAAAETF